MKNSFSAICKVFLVLICTNLSSQTKITEDSIVYGKFGTIRLYKPDNTPKEVVLFISGDAGWKYGVIDMARELAKRGALVAGIDILHYFKALQKEEEKCYYISVDFETLNQFIQKKYDFENFELPILAGYSSGATMTYGILAQAPNDTYKGAIALGFCPDIEINKPLCEGSGLKADSIKNGYLLRPRTNMSSLFIALTGKLDKVCNLESTKYFMSKLEKSKLYYLPKVGHGFSNQKNWMPQFIQAYDTICLSNIPVKSEINTGALESLAIKIYPAKNNSANMPMLIGISGDGGWRGLVDNMSNSFSEKGIPVIGIDALRYFWKYVPPEKVADDIAKIIIRYTKEWNRTKVMLLGYSFGANIIPFIIDRLPCDIKAKISMAIMLSPDDHADFEFHFASWLDKSSRNAFPVLPEINKLEGLKTLVFFGDEEKDPLKYDISPTIAKIIEVPGDHRYKDDRNKLVGLIIAEIAK
jgi:type IV secretory pathway VirJ component